ncbi:primary-amine oxidase [Kineococcus sp. T13]|uniref:primary-amine oxidase n=1 Tax=Kineococcus vitellinus TaxID=2696565 RepID=UPI001412C1CA|nr:primary-amine oxidase [Kineococcus vitellinus]NAZ77045.1 primary-amine oxidase [Kineococcus vitellinus]
MSRRPHSLETTVSAHPLDRLSAEEIETNREVLTAAGLVHAGTRFPLVTLAEPAKADVLSWKPGDPLERRVRTILLDRADGTVTEVLTSLSAREVVSTRAVDVRTEGQPPIMLEEFDIVEQTLWAHEGWNAAMTRRGISEHRRVRISALSAGTFDLPGEEGRRLTRCLAFLQLSDDDNVWAHPIDGVVAYVDLNTREVVELLDEKIFEIPRERYDFHLPQAERTTQKPIVISQPEGPSFSVDGDVVEWEGWRFRLGYSMVEGLILHQIGFRDRTQDERIRPIVYRASIAEMVVPYGDPSPVRFWQNYFDAGEYSLSREANSLALGCDCLGEIRYFDGVVHDDDGHARTIRNAICMHEEDTGLLWKHTDGYSGASSTRRQRRLVISFFITVGNYDYGFYWYLYLDGTIELECKATGVVFASAYPQDVPRGSYPWASEIASGIGAPYHQHLFSARLDMQIDGEVNAVDEVEVQRVPMGPDNPYGNAFTRRSRRLRTELEGVREADNRLGRVWAVSNPGVRNAVGEPVKYVLLPEGLPTLLADENSSIARRAAFTTKHLWVTAHSEAERHPSGDFVNQSSGGRGIDTWIQADRSIDGADVVLWHTFGLTHFPRPEDWPIMPVDTTGFVLKPEGFFDRNPALDAPDPARARRSGGASAAAAHGTAHGAAGGVTHGAAGGGSDTCCPPTS